MVFHWSLSDSKCPQVPKILLSIIITIIIIVLFSEFFIPALVDSFSQEFKWHQVSRTFLSILINNVVIWIVFTRPLISESSSPRNNFLVIEIEQLSVCKQMMDV